MQEDIVKIQAISEFNDTMYGSEFDFIIDTCTNLKAKSGATNCAGQDAEQEVLEKIIVEFKISTKFFSPHAYIENGEQMPSFFKLDTF